MIRKSIELCDKTLIFIGSAQEQSTQKNPFSYKFRDFYLFNYSASLVSSASGSKASPAAVNLMNLTAL